MGHPHSGAWLRLLFGPGQRRLQFLPAFVAGLALLAWLGRRQGPWCWEAQIAPLLPASSLTAAFGWRFDQVVLLAVVVALVSQVPAATPAHQAVVLGSLGASQLALWALNRVQVDDILYFWNPLVLAGLYWYSAVRGRRHGDDGERG